MNEIWNLFDDLPRYRLSEDANPDRCRKCHSAIWVAIDRAGFEIKLDTNLLTATEDLAHYQEMRPTWRITRSAHSFVIDYRSRMDLLNPKQTMNLAIHRCTDNPALTHPQYWPKPQYDPTEGIPF
jgi:hypothetical protein